MTELQVRKQVLRSAGGLWLLVGVLLGMMPFFIQTGSNHIVAAILSIGLLMVTAETVFNHGFKKLIDFVKND